MKPVRLESPASRSRVKHSTTEPLRSQVTHVISRHNSLIYHPSSMALIYNYQVTKLFGSTCWRKLTWKNGHFQHISKKIASSVLVLPLSQINSLDRMLFYKKSKWAWLGNAISCTADQSTASTQCLCSSTSGILKCLMDNSTNFNIRKMTKLQRWACKCIFGREYAHLEEACNRLKMLSLMVFRW